MIVNMKPVSNGQSAAPAVKRHNHLPDSPRVAILHDSTIGKYTFRLRCKYEANGPSRICIAHALGRSKKCAEGWINADPSLKAKNVIDLAILRFEPMHRSEFELLLHFQQNDRQMYGLADAA